MNLFIQTLLYLYFRLNQAPRPKFSVFSPLHFAAPPAFSSIPSIILYAVNGYLVSESIVESILTLALSIFIFSKVYQSRTLTPAEECDVAKSISALAALREEEIKEQRNLSRAHDSNNIVENDDAEDAANYTFDLPEVEPKTDFSPDEADSDPAKND